MPISSSAYSLERKKVLKCKQKSLTPNSQTTQNATYSIKNNANHIKRSHSTVNTVKVNNEPLLLTTHPDGSVHIVRTSEEKEKNPDRICLDRKALTLLPILDNESNLRLLSVQHNLITSLENLLKQSFPMLVFLDVYDNQIGVINCLEHLCSLRVLLMGKNRIKDITGLDTLKNLEVLDLHGNQINTVNGLEHCQALKVLNLAGNQIKQIAENDLAGLQNLQELNLRRNRLRKLSGFNDMSNLQKLFLSNNDLQNIDDIHCLAKVPNIKEIAIDNNPIFQTGDCVSFLISYLPKLLNINAMVINEQARKSAMAWRRNKESSSDTFKDLTHNAAFNGRREEVISNARTNWELLRTQTKYISVLKSTVQKSNAIKPETDIITTKIVKRDKKLRTRSNLTVLPNKRPLMMARTNSMETDSSSNQSDQQFRLPPILVPIINKLEVASTSSIGPNVDSSMSSVASSNLSHSDEESEEDEIAPQLEDDNGDQASSKPIPVVPHSSESNTETSSNLSTNTISSNNASDSSAKRSAKLRRVIKSAMNPCTRSVPVKCPRAITAKPQAKKNETIQCVAPTLSREREQGGDYLIEICGRHLNVYGHGALRFIDKTWCQSKANDVHTINFNYANFNGICAILNKLKQRFPNAENFTFKETNIYCLGQLNALAEIQGMKSLTICSEGNPILEKKWKAYAIFRLGHWGLKLLNEQTITEDEITAANETYQSLCELILAALPNEILHPLLVRMRIDVSVDDDLSNCKKWLMQADPALRSVVSKEALQWKKTASSMQEDLVMRQKARSYICKLLSELCNTIRKTHLFAERWPKILHEIVRNALIDYSQIDLYTRHKLLELMKN